MSGNHLIHDEFYKDDTRNANEIIDQIENEDLGIVCARKLLLEWEHRIKSLESALLEADKGLEFYTDKEHVFSCCGEDSCKVYEATKETVHISDDDLVGKTARQTRAKIASVVKGVKVGSGK